jgi:hypothetical protein
LTAIFRSPKAQICALLVLQAAALAWQARRVGITYDEPHHLVDGYAWWQRQDDLFPSDTPPLTRITSGWVPHALGIAMPTDTEAWKNRWSFDIGLHLMERLEAAGARRLMFWTRLTFLIYPLALVWLVWQWARELFGDRVALVVAGATALEPNLLAHGPLIKSDVAAAVGAVLAAYLGWRYWREPRWSRLLAMSAGLLAAALAKFTLLALIPLALLLVLWRGPRLLGPPVVLGMVYAGVLLGYQVYDIQVVGKLPWPGQLVRGIRYIAEADRNEGFPAYLLGRRIGYAAPLYFPLAWAIKFPIALQLGTLAGMAALVRRRAAAAAAAFVWLPAAYLMALAVRSHIHIGFRHLLPVVPFCILGAGFALQRWGERRGARPAAVFGLVWLGGASAWIYPQGISYFNEWIGGPRNGWKYLADSNVDWGQNLPELGEWVARHHIGQLKTYYFGNDVLWHYIPHEKIVLQAAPWGREWEKETRLAPGPGVYAISVNTLTGHFFSPAYRDYFAWFKAREPDGRAGWSIFLYQVK